MATEILFVDQFNYCLSFCINNGFTKSWSQNYKTLVSQRNQSRGFFHFPTRKTNLSMEDIAANSELFVFRMVTLV